VASPPTSYTSASTGPCLRRVLSLRDLILYGIIVVSPVAPMSFFGILTQRGRGHAPTAILIAMFAMLLTAISYGRMARAYPSAGSAFTYAGKEISPALGYVIGWGMVMDYMVCTLICVIWCSQQGHVFVPRVPYWAWATFSTLCLTGLTAQGVRISARVNTVLVAGMGIVVALFLAAAAAYVSNQPHTAEGFFTRPFYDPQTWTWKAMLGGTSLAVLTYIGFDGVSTLAEEARNPRRDILLATISTCLVIGLLSVLEVYAAQLVWPTFESFQNLDTAFTFVAQRVWAPLFGVVGVTLLVANFGSGLGAQLAAARLLYGMGRSEALPKVFFGAIDPKRQVPRNNVLVVGAFALSGALLLPLVAGPAGAYELGANVLNFGALIAFMGVNAAAFMRYYWRAQNKQVINFILPVCGFFVCLLLWWNLGTQARIFGGTWMVLGIAFGAWKTRGFRSSLVDFDHPLAPAESSQEPPDIHMSVRQPHVIEPSKS
jgi:putrescine importer